MRRLAAMDQDRTPSTSSIDDLFTLQLVDGLPVDRDGKEIRYRTVRLRETGVAHEREAERQAERVVSIGGAPRLMVSDSEFAYAMTVLHIDAFECDGVKIPAVAIDRTVAGKLSTHDFGLIERRVFLITLAAEVRYGNISQAEFDEYLSGVAPKAQAAPQPQGQTADLGANPDAPESGPALLADFTGKPAEGSPSRHSR